jgi:dnd system-associated protein 4
MNNTIKSYRVKRPKRFDEFLKLLVNKDEGVFETLKSALIFSASIGFKQEKKMSFTDLGEGIPLNYFDDTRELPFIYAMAISEYDDVNFLREENFLEAIKIFEEYAAGGLSYLNDTLIKDDIKGSIESMLHDTEETDLIEDLTDDW